MSFNICRGTLGTLAMFTAIRNASSRDSRFIDARLDPKMIESLQPCFDGGPSALDHVLRERIA